MAERERIVILYDFDPSKDFFARTLRAHVAEASGLEVVNLGVPFVQPRNFVMKWWRAAQSVLFAVRASASLRANDHVLCWNQNLGIALSLYWRLTGTGRKQKIYITGTTNTPIRRNVVFRNILNYAFGGKNFRCFFANNAADMTISPAIYSSLRNDGKVRFVHFSNDIDFENKTPDVQAVTGEDYFVSSGRSNRNYTFFIDFFEKHPQFKYKIICDTLTQTTDAPNIQIYRDVYGAQNYAYILGSRALLLDLLHKDASSGNTVFVQTLELGVPIIMTRSKVLEDYAIDGKNCILIDDGNAKQLKAALERIQDDRFRAEMSAFQKRDHAERFSVRGFARAVVGVMQEDISKTPV